MPVHQSMMVSEISTIFGHTIIPKTTTEKHTECHWDHNDFKHWNGWIFIYLSPK